MNLKQFIYAKGGAFLLIMLSLWGVGCQPSSGNSQPEAAAVNVMNATPTAAVSTTAEAKLSVTPAVEEAVEEEAAAVEPTIDPSWTAALEACANTQRNQVCQQGTISDVLPHGLSWDSATGNMPLLQLEANLDEGEGTLTIVGLGTGQLVELTTLINNTAEISFVADGETAVEDEAPFYFLEPAPQQITFFSDHSTEQIASGLLIMASPKALITTLGINGTQLTLVGNVWAEAVAGQTLQLTVLSGDVMAEAAGEVQLATAGQQLAIPISPDGLATAAPELVAKPTMTHAQPLAKFAQQVQTATYDESDLLTPLVPPSENLEDLLTPLVPPSDDEDLLTPLIPSSDIEQKLTRIHYRHFLHSYNRCLSNRPDAARYVYNTVYYLRVIQQISYMRERLGTAGMARLMDMARQCATFEVDFISTMTLDGGPVAFTAETKAEGVKIQFTPEGGPFSGDIQTLQYRTLNVTGMDVPGCTLNIEHPDGTLRIDDGSLRINGNGLALRLNMLPEVPQESFSYACAGHTTQPSAYFNWFPLFMGLYADIFSEKGFTVTNWRYVGTELMAEAILEREMIVDGATLSSTTAVVLVHTPQK